MSQRNLVAPVQESVVSSFQNPDHRWVPIIPGQGHHKMLPPSILSELSSIVGREWVFSEADRLLVYESDAQTAHNAIPQAVVLPADTREAAAVAGVLHGHGLPMVARGAGTGLSGGALAVGGGVVVGTSRMNRILEVDPENRRALVQAGVQNTDLTAAVAPFGLHYAPDPSSQTACTIGGNVAENSGGPHCLKYGVTSRYITGLRVVLPGGDTVWLGGQGREVAGFDLVGLFVGSEGCFGLATEVEVALTPVPEATRTLLAIFDSLEDAGRAVTRIISSGLLPAALEIVDQNTIRAVEASIFAAGYPTDAGAALVVEFDGPQEALGPEGEAARLCCQDAGAREIRLAESEEERLALWKGRKKAFGAMGRLAPDLLVQDATVPRTRLPEVLARVSEIAEAHDLRVANVFHAGDGNLHPNIVFDRRDPDESRRVQEASREIMQVCVDAGGTITGEHGVGVDKRKYMPLVFSREELAALGEVKEVFDPDHLCNPGKVLPDNLPEIREAAPAGPAVRGRKAGESPESTPEQIRKVLGDHLPSESVTVPGVGDGWRTASGEGGHPKLIVAPATEEEVATVLRLSSEMGWTVLPAGRGSWLLGGGPCPVDLVLSTRRLDAVYEYEPADLTFTAGAGITLGALHAKTEPRGQWLPLDPPAGRGGTLGAVVACGLQGPLRALYGTPRDHVLGLTLVSGDGRILRWGGRVVKNVAGFDMTRLCVGSWGLLGVVTRVSARLFPLPDCDRTLLVRGETALDIAETVRVVARSGLPVAGLELLAPLPPWGSVGETESGGDSSPALAVRLLGSGGHVQGLQTRLEALLSQSGLSWESLEAEGSRTFHEHLGLWEEDAELVVRLRRRPSSLPTLVEDVQTLREGALQQFPDTQVRMWAHGLSGILTFAIHGPVPWEEAGTWWAEMLGRLRERLENQEGSLSLSQAPAQVSRLLEYWGRQGPEQSILRKLKARFDPRGILAPGRMGL